MRCFWRHQGGNVAILFGLAMVPLLVLSGGAVDLAYTAKVRNDLQSAADAAAIAAAEVVQTGRVQEHRDGDQLNAVATAKAKNVFDAALASKDRSDYRLHVSIEGNIVKISSDLEVPTSFLKLVGVKTLNADATTEVRIPNPIAMEVVLALDYSGSMRENEKYRRMTAAAQKFIRRVEAEGAAGSKIGLVPFSEYVLADVPHLYVRGSGGVNGGGNGSNGSGSTNSGNGSCLLNRDYPYSATDAPPNALAASQWPEGDPGKCSQYHNKNLKVRDLTDDFDALVQAMDRMEPIGLTNISLAAEMGWHVLSPDRPFDTARDYSDELMEKVLILLTDGMQTVQAMGPGGAVSMQAADEVTAEICENAKDLGVRVFSVAYDVSDDHVRRLVLGCASDADSYFDARSVSDISGVFEQIFSQIIESVWVSQ